MKLNIIALFIVSISCLMTSCTKDDDLSEGQTIYDIWTLKNETGGRLDYSLDYEGYGVIWYLNEDTGLLTVDKNVPNSGYLDYYHHLESGNYDFEIIEDNNDQILYVNDRQIGYISIDDETLIIDERSLYNNFILTFERNP